MKDFLSLRKKYLAPMIFALLGQLLGCASSDVSRGAAGSLDEAYLATQKPTRVNVANGYENSSQMAKGVLIGGVTGGVVGGLSNGVGVYAGGLTGAILGGALGAYIDAHTTLVDRLQNRGVRVFVLGDQVLIVLMSNRIFYPMTATLDYSAYTTLQQVAELIGNYVNMSVKVAAYTDASESQRVSLALSQEQANSVAKALWRYGVNTRLLYSVGYGGVNLITKNSLNWDKNQNYRVEITLEKLPV